MTTELIRNLANKELEDVKKKNKGIWVRGKGT